jgi:hypothetical protein
MNHIQDQLSDLRITVRRIQDFLEQPEISLNEEVKAPPAHPDYAVHIENQSFTWGV